MKTIRYSDKDPRAGGVASMDDAEAQRLIDSGAATEVSGDEADAGRDDAERDAAKRVGGDPEEATRQLQRNREALKATAPSPSPAPTTAGSGAAEASPAPSPSPAPTPAPTSAPAPATDVTR